MLPKMLSTYRRLLPRQKARLKVTLQGTLHLLYQLVLHLITSITIRHPLPPSEQLILLQLSISHLQLAEQTHSALGTGRPLYNIRLTGWDAVHRLILIILPTPKKTKKMKVWRLTSRLSEDEGHPSLTMPTQGRITRSHCHLIPKVKVPLPPHPKVDSRWHTPWQPWFSGLLG